MRAHFPRTTNGTISYMAMPSIPILDNDLLGQLSDAGPTLEATANICSSYASGCKNRRVEIGNAREVYGQPYPSNIRLADQNGKDTSG